MLLPLLLLAGLGWRGIQVSREETLASARRQAERALEAMTPSMVSTWRGVREHALPLRVYPDPPTPTPPDAAPDAAAQAIYAHVSTLADTDPAGARAQLEQLASYPDALAPSGVPLLPLTCWLRVRLEPDPARLPARLSELMEAALNTHPSVLTPELLTTSLSTAAARGVDPKPWSDWLDRWKIDESLRAAWRQRPRATDAARPSSPVWLLDQDGGNWLVLAAEHAAPTATPDRQVLRLLPRREILQAVTGMSRLQSLLPEEATAWFSVGGQPVLEGEGEVLASRDLGNNLRVQVALARPARLYARQRQQTLWLAALLASALAASLAGFWTLRRALLRERQLGELKSNFVASVSHELRAPLASVRLLAENLESDAVPTAARRREYHGFIAEECRRLSALIDNVLDFARIEQNRRPYDFAETDAPALVADAVQLMRPRAAQRRQEILMDLQPLDPPPVCDGLAVWQALINLLDNAVKFSPVETTIHVRVGPSDAASWQIAVRDEGPGIPPAEHAAIFERFHRLGSELRRETPGAGIGLSIVRHLAQAHGGRVEVASQPGAGSTFTLVLPRLPPNAAASS